MSSEPFRFLHAADLHLEQPPAGLSEVPDHLRMLLIDAPRLAAEQVFDCAVVEEVDFVVLAGDVIDVHRAEAGAVAFLFEQFERLAELGIRVYWAGGPADPAERWPVSLPLPESVHVFSDEAIETVVHYRERQPVASLTGRSGGGRRIRPADYHDDGEAPLAIAVAHGKIDADQLAALTIDYWALGGRHNRKSVLSAPCHAIYPGTPQGRADEHPGLHSCTLVRVDEQGAIHPRIVPTDVVRWQRETVHIGVQTTPDTLLGELRQRTRSLLEAIGDRTLLITWQATGAGPLVAGLRRGGLGEELSGKLRAEFGFGSPAAWTVGIETEQAADIPPAYYEEDTILGDFLRALQQTSNDEEEMQRMQAFLEMACHADQLPGVAGLDEEEQQRVLRETATLAVDLLHGTEGWPS